MLVLVLIEGTITNQRRIQANVIAFPVRADSYIASRICVTTYACSGRTSGSLSYDARLIHMRVSRSPSVSFLPSKKATPPISVCNLVHIKPAEGLAIDAQAAHMSAPASVPRSEHLASSTFSVFSAQLDSSMIVAPSSIVMKPKAESSTVNFLGSQGPKAFAAFSR